MACPPPPRIFASATGVRQGDPLGPLYFALAEARAMRNVSVDGVPLHKYRYADDGMLMFRSSDVTGGEAVATGLFLAVVSAFAGRTHR